MSYLSSSPPESWELEEVRFLNSIVSTLSYGRRLAMLLTVGMVAAIEISNRLSINVFLPDMQGNVGASSDQISWVIILYNVGYLCSIALAYWMTRVIGTRSHLLLSIAIYATGAMGCVLSTGNLTQLLVSRLIMGFGGGAFLVRVVILSGVLFPGKARLAAVTRLYPFFLLLRSRIPLSWGGSPIRFTGIMLSWLIFPFWRSVLFSSGKLSRQVAYLCAGKRVTLMCGARSC